MGLMRKGVVDAMVSVVVVTFVIPNCQQSQLWEKKNCKKQST